MLEFLEGELSPEETRLVERLVRADPGLATRLAVLKETGTALTNAFGHLRNASPPEATLQLLQRLSTESADVKKRARGRGWYSIAASVAVGMLVGGIGLRTIENYYPVSDGPVSSPRPDLRTRGIQKPNTVQPMSNIGEILKNIFDGTEEGKTHQVVTPSGRVLSAIVKETLISTDGRVCRTAQIVPPEKGAATAALSACLGTDGRWKIVGVTSEPAPPVQ